MLFAQSSSSAATSAHGSDLLTLLSLPVIGPVSAAFEWGRFVKHVTEVFFYEAPSDVAELDPRKLLDVQLAADEECVRPLIEAVRTHVNVDGMLSPLEEKAEILLYNALDAVIAKALDNVQIEHPGARLARAFDFQAAEEPLGESFRSQVWNPARHLWFQTVGFLECSVDVDLLALVLARGSPYAEQAISNAMGDVETLSGNDFFKFMLRFGSLDTLFTMTRCCSTVNEQGVVVPAPWYHPLATRDTVSEHLTDENHIVIRNGRRPGVLLVASLYNPLLVKFDHYVITTRFDEHGVIYYAFVEEPDSFFVSLGVLVRSLLTRFFESNDCYTSFHTDIRASLESEVRWRSI